MRVPIWRRRREKELEEEIQSHLAMSAKDRQERGETGRQALASARREQIHRQPDRGGRRLVRRHNAGRQLFGLAQHESVIR
jgi:hypothetical protein